MIIQTNPEARPASEPDGLVLGNGGAGVDAGTSREDNGLGIKKESPLERSLASNKSATPRRKRYSRSPHEPSSSIASRAVPAPP